MAASKKPAARKTAPKGEGAGKERKLTPKQERFVDEYLIDLNASAAALRAGYASPELGRRLVTKSHVADAITKRRAEVAEEVKIDATRVLREWIEIAFGDPNDLVQYRRNCCRNCWGFGHAYQWTDAELEGARLDAINKGKPGPDESGGAGFDLNREPNPLCPECGGEGRGRMIVADTRKIPAQSRRLYAGVKLGKDGLEIKMRDQDGALGNIAKHLGMFPSRVELTGKNGSPIQHQAVAPDLSNLSDDELSTLEAIAAKLGRSPRPGDDSG